MKSISRHLTLAVLGAGLACGAALAQPKIPPKYPASALEIAYLPKYCYQQYVDGALQGEFTISNCGGEMNHFCPALVSLTQASQASRIKSERRGAVNAALGDIEYTLRGMTPACPIADDVRKAKERAKAMATVLK